MHVYWPYGRDQAGPGVPYVGLASQQWGYVMHAFQTIVGVSQDVCIKTKAPALGPCYCPKRPSTLLGFSFSCLSLNSKRPLGGLGGGLGKPEQAVS